MEEDGGAVVRHPSSASVTAHGPAHARRGSRDARRRHDDCFAGRRPAHDGAGQWWGGWIIDTATGAETHIGDIRATSGTGELAHAISFDEYFGPAQPCDKVPYSFARFLPPILEAGAATASAGATARGDCSGGSVTAEPDGSRARSAWRCSSRCCRAVAAPLDRRDAQRAMRRSGLVGVR